MFGWTAIPTNLADINAWQSIDLNDPVRVFHPLSNGTDFYVVGCWFLSNFIPGLVGARSYRFTHVQHDEAAAVALSAQISWTTSEDFTNEPMCLNDDPGLWAIVYAIRTSGLQPNPAATEIPGPLHFSLEVVMRKNGLVQVTIYWVSGLSRTGHAARIDQINVSIGEIAVPVVRGRTPEQETMLCAISQLRDSAVRRQPYGISQQGFQMIEPMFAKAVPFAEISQWMHSNSGPFLLQEKLDGVHIMCAMVNGKLVAWTRKKSLVSAHILEVIAKTCIAVLANLPRGAVLDGEIHIAGIPCTTITGLLNAKTVTAVHRELLTQLRYSIFDVVLDGMNAYDRNRTLFAAFSGLGRHGTVAPLETQVVVDAKDAETSRVLAKYQIAHELQLVTNSARFVCNFLGAATGGKLGTETAGLTEATALEHLQSYMRTRIFDILVALGTLAFVDENFADKYFVVACELWHTQKNYVYFRTNQTECEGVICRLGNSVYRSGSRAKNMIKAKNYYDITLSIKRIVSALGTQADHGLFVFEHNGHEFQVIPCGDSTNRVLWLKRPDLVVGRNVVLKYYNITEDGRLVHPTAISLPV